MKVNNQAYNLQAASSILERVVAGLLLTPNLIEQLKLIPYSEPLAGFHVAKLGAWFGHVFASSRLLPPTSLVSSPWPTTY